MARKRVGRPPSHSGRRPLSAKTTARVAAARDAGLAEGESMRLTLIEAMADGERERQALANEIEKLKLELKVQRERCMCRRG